MSIARGRTLLKIDIVTCTNPSSWNPCLFFLQLSTLFQVTVINTLIQIALLYRRGEIHHGFYKNQKLKIKFKVFTAFQLTWLFPSSCCSGRYRAPIVIFIVRLNCKFFYERNRSRDLILSKSKNLPSSRAQCRKNLKKRISVVIRYRRSWPEVTRDWFKPICRISAQICDVNL